MKTLQVSDELFEKLKDFVVDPFEDTPEVILGRLMEIVNKAKSKWSPLIDEPRAAADKIESDLSDEDSDEAGDVRYRPLSEAAALT